MSISKLLEINNKLIMRLKMEILFFKNRQGEFGMRHPHKMKLWEKKFVQMIRYSVPQTLEMAEEFLTVELELVTERNAMIREQIKPLLVCAIKNDITRIQIFMEHYRVLGIEQFVFVDNMSTDGTFEYLCQQKDATVYRCAHEFSAERKDAWINRIIAEYGDYRWYLIVDSDEFISYIECSKYKIADVIKKAEESGYTRIEGFMTDMYSEQKLFSLEENEDFREACCFLDKDTYTLNMRTYGKWITGGPRMRVFGKKQPMSKLPLVYIEEDDMVGNSHYMVPLDKNESAPIWFVLLHYKFLDHSDYLKVKEAVETGIHKNNSENYKKYWEVISENEELSFYSEEHSIKYSEQNLNEIPLLNKIF